MLMSKIEQETIEVENAREVVASDENRANAAATEAQTLKVRDVLLCSKICVITPLKIAFINDTIKENSGVISRQSCLTVNSLEYVSEMISIQLNPSFLSSVDSRNNATLLGMK